MFYIPDILTKRGKLSYCWLAGVLSEQMFKSKVSTKKLLDINISATCDEIIKVLNVRSDDHRVRFSLYLSSRLMYGVVKVYLYQLNLFEKTLSVTQYNLHPVRVSGGKKKKVTQKDPKTITLEDNFNITDTIPEPPPVDFGKISWRDVNLMPEVSPESLRRNREALEAARPYFPALTNEQADAWINTDFVEADSDLHRVSVNPPHEDVSVPPADASSINVDVPALEETTGHKRRISDAIDSRPAKRRRTLGPELDAVAEELLASNLPDQEESAGAIGLPHSLQPIEEEGDAFLLPEALPVAEPVAVPIPVLEALPVPPTRPPPVPAEVCEQPKKTKKKRRGKIIDKNPQLPRTVIQRRASGDLEAHTVAPLNRLAKPEQTCVVPVSKMLHYPSKTFKYYPDRFPIVRQRIYNNELIEDFKIATSAPLVMETEFSEILEFIRKKNETLEQVSALPNKTATEGSSKEETLPELLVVNNAEPVQDEAQAAGTTHDIEVETTGGVPLPFAEVSAEHGLEDSEANAPEQQQPEIDYQPVAFEHPENEEVIQNVNGSDPDTQNLDAFLPECLKGRDKTTKLSKERKRPEAVIDIASSVSSERSDEMIENVWPIHDFIGTLEVLWHDHPVLPFKTLHPPETTRRVEAAGSLNLLLELRKQKRVFLEQRDQIYIARAG